MDALYIHIPFCIKKCSYCDFLSLEKKSEKEMSNYAEYIIREIKLYPETIYDTVYFGGGTPSLMSAENLEKILSSVQISENAEITLEVNPGTVTEEDLSKYMEIGINRLSIGIQSFDDKFLKILGRIHSSAQGKEIFRAARKVGFENISLDLMFSLPFQTLDDVASDLRELFSLNPNHFSIYSLIWEEGTEIHKRLLSGEYCETENSLEADMYRYIIDAAKEAGFTHYEISNFAKPGMESRHNTKYWKNNEYLGIGLGSSGYIGKERYKNVEDFSEYYAMIDSGSRPVEEREDISEREKEEYRIILGLRLLNEGVTPSEENLEIFDSLYFEGYLEKNGDKFLLSQKGIFYANDVFSEFI